MKDERAASRLAAEAYELWQADRLEEAEPVYQQALALAPPDALALAEIHGELAAVLEGLGKLAQAEQHYAQALRVELDCAADPHDIGVVIARYFLAEFLLRLGHAQRALECVAPHIVGCTDGVWLFHLIAAEASVALGDAVRAEQAARLALRAAPSEDKRSELRLRFLAGGLYLQDEFP